MALASLALLTSCRPTSTSSRPPVRLPRIGFFAGSAAGAYAEAFGRGLNEHGWVDGQNLAIEYRTIEESPERVSQALAELIRLPVDVIVAAGTETAAAARDLTGTIPIVMAVSADPVGAGLIVSLARPGGNVTGVTTQSSQLSAKRLEILRDLAPGRSRVAALLSVPNPAKEAEFRELASAARGLGIGLQSLEMGQSADLDQLFQAALEGHAEALIVLHSTLTFRFRARILELAARGGLPAMYSDRAWVLDGGLASYGHNLADQYQRAADYVDRILRGAQPAELPVEQSSAFYLNLNTKTARELGLTIPASILQQAAEVIQ